jgi:hypothetical protein
VGATTNGAPTSGTYLAGDYVVAKTGSFWICTVAGTPGTWVQMQGNTIVGSPVTGVAGVTPIVSSGGVTPSISWDSTYAINQSNSITGTWLKPSGVGNATAATRFVGGTASVAPTTGTFQVGDYVVTQNAKIFVCITAGTPGTWSQIVGAAAPTTATWVMISRVVVTVSGTGIINFGGSLGLSNYLDIRVTGLINTLPTMPNPQYIKLYLGFTSGQYLGNLWNTLHQQTGTTIQELVQNNSSGSKWNYAATLSNAANTRSFCNFEILIPNTPARTSNWLLQSRFVTHTGTTAGPHSTGVAMMYGANTLAGDLVTITLATTDVNGFDTGSEAIIWGQRA